MRFLEWSYAPDPSDTHGVTVYSFIVREADGTVTTHSETHAFGVFREATWTRLLESAGFVPEVVMEQTEEERSPRGVHRAPARVTAVLRTNNTTAATTMPAPTSVRASMASRARVCPSTSAISGFT